LTPGAFRESYLDMVMTVIVSCIIALVAVLMLGTAFWIVLTAELLRS
jgi:hypothetical protein